MEVVCIEVKCKYCGRKVEKAFAYKIVSGSKNNYYCTRQEYVNSIQANAFLCNVKSKSLEILDNTTNTLLFKELKDIANVHGYEKISHYLDDNEDYLYKVIHAKTFSSEYCKIKYFTAIIRNNIGDYVIQEPEPVRQVEVEIVDLQKYKQKKKRRSLADIEEDL